jgi:hypothetical protein
MRIADVKVVEGGRERERERERQLRLVAGNSSEPITSPPFPPLPITNSDALDTRYVAPQRGQTASLHGPSLYKRPYKKINS